MGIFVAVSIALLVSSVVFRDYRFTFVFWFPAAATTIVVSLLAFNGYPHLESGPGGLSVLGLIPIFIIWGCCGLVALLCFFLRPNRLAWNPRIIIGTVICYSVVLVIAFRSPSFWGYYPIDVEVKDWSHKPVPGVTVHSQSQKENLLLLMNSFLTNDPGKDFTTDTLGRVRLQANINQMLLITINGQDFPAYRSEYGNAYSHILPPSFGRTTF